MALRKKVLRLNVPLKGFSKGAAVLVVVDQNGVVLDQYWRRRVKDATTDNCVQFVNPKKKKDDVLP
jgi:hypothetical protein